MPETLKPRQVPELDDPRNPFAQLTPAYDIAATATPARASEPGYYGLPILKRPFWKWEIALYFFFEGISSGSFVLCSMAGLTGKPHFRPAIARGRYLSFLSMLPCPPLLIADLGRPERFLHMLRIFKRTSPMNHGAWALSAYSLVASTLALIASPLSRLPFGGPLFRLLERILPTRLLELAGLPFALTMISYPGVLLSTTANPVWSHTNFLGPLFAASSMSNGAAALTLCNYTSGDEAVHTSLARVEDLSSAVEAAAVALYVATARKAARPLLKGRQSSLFLLGAIGLGLIAPALLRRSRSRVVRSGLAPVLTLAGGLALKWSITYAGQESAMDPELASQNAPGPSGKPFWGPKASAPSA